MDIQDTGHFFRDLGVPVAVLHRGQSLTIPVVLIDRPRMNVVVKDETQLVETNEQRAENRWWEAFISTPFAFEVTLPNGRDCLLNQCQDLRKVAYTSATKVWFTEGGVSR